jgi:hypothetical protein
MHPESTFTFSIDYSRKLGDGSYGQVFLCSDSEGLEWAVKVYKLSYIKSIKLVVY